MQARFAETVMLAWVIIAIVIAFSLVSFGLTMTVGAKRAPKEFPPYLLLLFLLGFAISNWGTEWTPLPSMVDTAVKLVGVAFIYYFLYRSGPMLKAWTQRRLGWPRA